MKREIKFRGKSTDTGKWIYGFLSFFYTAGRDENGLIFTDKARIYSPEDGCCYDVWAETVGEFTGLCDKNGEEIYEGDIVECNGDICKVMYSNHYAGFALDKKGWLYLHFFGEAFSNKDCLVIGNIHNNIELLK